MGENNVLFGKGCPDYVDKMFGVYTGKRTYHYDGINVLPVADFLKRLHEGDVF